MNLGFSMLLPPKLLVEGTYERLLFKVGDLAKSFLDFLTLFFFCPLSFSVAIDTVT